MVEAFEQMTGGEKDKPQKDESAEPDDTASDVTEDGHLENPP
jgi:hypothetical protein